MRRLPSGLAVALVLSSCAPRADRLVVCARNTTELRLLGEVVAQQLQRRTKLEVKRRFGETGALTCHRALVSGDVDVYPEFTAMALVTIIGHRGAQDPATALLLVAREFPARYGASWLPSFDPDNRAAAVVREAALRRHPEIRAALLALAGTVSDSATHRMIAEVDVQHRDPAQVARQFLAGLTP